MVVAQQPTEALSTHHQPTLLLHTELGDNKLVPKPLMISLVMVMGQVRLDHRAERRLSDHDHPMKCFVFDRADEPLAIGIEIRAPWRQDDWLYPAGAQHSVEAMHELFVPVVEQVPPTQEEAIQEIRQLPGALRHEGISRMRGDARNMHSAGAEL